MDRRLDTFYSNDRIALPSLANLFTITLLNISRHPRFVVYVRNNCRVAIEFRALTLVVNHYRPLSRPEVASPAPRSLGFQRSSRGRGRATIGNVFGILVVSRRYYSVAMCKTSWRFVNLDFTPRRPLINAVGNCYSVTCTLRSMHYFG